MLYPRDPTLDPQLVWRGKDAQDAEPLAVPAVPIYIQEKIHPQALIENLRKTAKAGEPEPEQLLFSDFNGLPGDFETTAGTANQFLDLVINGLPLDWYTGYIRAVTAVGPVMLTAGTVAAAGFASRR